MTTNGWKPADPVALQRMAQQTVRAQATTTSAYRRRESRPRGVEVLLVGATDTVVLAPLLLLDSLLTIVTVAIAGATWNLKGLYSRRIALSVLDDLPSLAGGALLAIAATTIILPEWHALGTAEVLLTLSGAIAGMVVGRSVAYALILNQRAAGRINYPTLVVGAGASSASLVRRIQAHPESGLRLVGILADRVAGLETSLPLLGSCRDLGRIVNERHITDVVVGYGGMSSASLVEVLRACDRAHLEIHVLPRLFELHALRGRDDHIWGLPLVRISGPAQRSMTWRLKRTFDIVLAATLLLLSFPVFIAVAAAVRVSLGRGVFFRQTRIGLNGTPFELLKFRSMSALSPQDGQSPWTVPQARIGRVGRFIRRYSLDELPQLINVLWGDMSLVGPRPERPEFVEQFSVAFPRYVHRHRVPVGMTGLAAVNGLRGDTSIEDRAHFDNWYIDNWTLWLDLKIMMRTFASVMRGTGA